MIYHKKPLGSLFIAIFIAILFLMCVNIFFYRYCIIKEILVKEYDIANYNIGKICLDSERNCKALMKEFRIQGLVYKNQEGVIIKEIGDVSKPKNYPSNIYKLNILPKITLNPTENMHNLSIIGSNLLRLIDSYFIDGYTHNGYLEQMVISSDFPDYNISAFINISKTWNHINNATKRISLISVCVLSFFIVIMLYNAYYVGYIVHDMHESKLKAETENSEKTEFLSNVSHELRTPLNSIIGFAEIMLYKSFGELNEHYQGYVENIHNSGKHLLSIINDLLDLQKASASKLNIDMMDVDLNKVAVASMNFLKPRASENNITLKIKKPREHTIIKADPKRLKQTFLNLLSNAVKFTEEGGSVTLEIIPNYVAKKAIIKIIDTGIGIKEEDIPRVIAGFYQIDGRLNKKYEGTGIGLPLTLKLVELMGGRMEITSSLNKGTTIILEFDMNANFGLEV
jgi:signal transduction histidine kinase